MTIGIYSLAVRATSRSGSCPPTHGGSGSRRCVSYDLSLLLAAPRRAPRRAVLGRARGAPPERGLQPLDRAAPDRRATGSSAGSSTCRWRCSACRRWCSRWSCSSTCSTSSGPHTRQIGKLGWFDRWFCSPSNHRVHHAVNDKLRRPQLRRHPDRLGPPVRHLRRKRTTPSPASTARAARCAAGTRCGPTCRSMPTWCATPGTRARWRRQAARLVQAARLAAGRRGGARPKPPSRCGRAALRPAGEPRRARPRPASSCCCSARRRPSCGRRTRSSRPRSSVGAAAAIVAALWLVGLLSDGERPRPRPGAGATGR